jgi:guanylate kinase
MDNHPPPDGSLALVVLLSGPAGSGKTTLCERMVGTHPGVQRVVTSTTRPPRPGEVHGRDYYFFDDNGFDQAVGDGLFLEWARVHAHRYGTLRSEVLGKLDRAVDVVLNVDVQGAANFRRAADGLPALSRRLVTIFIMPERLDEMRGRLIGRGAAPEDIERRMRTAEREIAAWREFDYCFISRSRDEDFARLEQIWRSEKLSVRRQ